MPEAVVRWRCNECGALYSYEAGAFYCEKADVDSALAAATGTAKTAKPVECEASQSGPQGNAQPQEDPNG